MSFLYAFWSELSLLLPFLNASIYAWLPESLLLYPRICSKLWSLDMTFYFYIAFWFTRYAYCGEITFWKDINREKFSCYRWRILYSNWYFLKVKIPISTLFSNNNNNQKKKKKREGKKIIISMIWIYKKLVATHSIIGTLFLVFLHS